MMIKKLSILGSLVFSGLMTTSIMAQDFTVPFSVMNTQNAAEQACSKVSSDLKMDEKKATALVLWLGLCQPAYVNKLMENQGLFVLRDGQYYFESTDTVPATPEDLMRSFYQHFGDIDVTEIMPENTIPYKIIYYPLINYGYNPEGATIKVWTHFPTQMPIGELLADAGSRDLFCQSSELPRDEFHLSSPSQGYGPITCPVPGLEVSHREKIELPSLPQAPKGRTEAEKSRNLLCHELRIRAARAGAISHSQLSELTLENSVPIFSERNDPNSSVMGFEACITNEIARNAKKIDTFQFNTLPGVKVSPAMQRTQEYFGGSDHQSQYHWPEYRNGSKNGAQKATQNIREFSPEDSPHHTLNLNK